MTLSVPNIHISGDRSELLFTHEEALSWFVSLQEEYEASVDQLGNCSLNIALFTKTKMQDMNKKFAGKDNTTNVISFPSNEIIGSGEKKIWPFLLGRSPNLIHCPFTMNSSKQHDLF